MERTLGPFTLERRLGAGGMAEAFVALRRGPSGFEQRVCIKRILPNLASEPSFVALFLDEARIQSRLRHANIVSVYDFGEDHGSYYLALELIDGVDLETLLRCCRAGGHALPLEIAVHILASLLRALEVAHGNPSGSGAHPIVHRDVSPSNLLLSTQGEVKLTDFGIAHIAGKGVRTATGVIRGKIGYMAPEQIQWGVADARSDLFAAGATAYAMLAGEHPFRVHGASDYEILQRVVRGERKDLREARADVPDELAALVDALLDPDPGKRPQDARDALERLARVPWSPVADRALAQWVRYARDAGPSAPAKPPAITRTAALPDAAYQAQEIAQLAAPVRSRRALVSLVAACVLALAAAAVWMFSPGTPAASVASSHEATAARSPVVAAAPEPRSPIAATAREPLVRVPVAAPTRAQPTGSAPAGDATRVPAGLDAGAPTSPKRNASLRILVAPHGEVWLNGRSLGAAPRTRSLLPGPYVVEVGRDGVRLVREHVTLRAGEQRTLRIRLPN